MRRADPVTPVRSRRADREPRADESWTISRLAEAFSLSRSTLLYYDRIGLLSPSSRTSSGYRLYDPTAVARLHRICSLRETGVPLEDIQALLAEGEDGIHSILIRRLEGIGAEMARLRIQQLAVRALLARNDGTGSPADLCDRNILRENLRKAGMDDLQMRSFHAFFETNAPDAHADLLRFLGFSSEESAVLRDKVRQHKPH